MPFGSGGAAAEAPIQGAAPGDVVERGRRSLMVPPGTASHPKSAQIPSLPNAKNCSLCFLPETGGNGGGGTRYTPNRAVLRARAQFHGDAVEGAGGSTLPVLMGAHAACATRRVPSANVLLIIFN